MGYQQSSVHAYRQTRVKTATQGRIIVMLYDEAIRQLDDAIALLKGDSRALDRVNNAVVKAQDIVTELMVSLDMDEGGEISRNLLRLYLYFNEQLMDGNVRKDPEPLAQVRGLLDGLRDAWRQIEQTTPAPRQAFASGGVNIAG